MFYPIFKFEMGKCQGKDGFDCATDEIKSFDSLALADDLTYLKSIRIGTLNLTTVENVDFDIEDGKEITLHVISVESSVGIGFVKNMNDYGYFIQEIVDTIVHADNKDLVESDIFKVMFPGID